MRRTINHVISHCQKYISNNNYENLSIADLLPYPTIRPMSSGSQNKRTLYVRYFQIFLLFFDVKKCHCFGHVLINYDDQFLPTNTDLGLKHLSNKFHKSWYCSCDVYCNKGQFCLAILPSHMRHYAKNHDNRNPYTVLGTHVTNASLCDACHK